jgi:histidine ammonia-lyase
MHSALTAMQMTTILHDAVAILLITAGQAIDLRGGGEGLGKGSRAVYEIIRREVPFVEEDRPLDGDIKKVTELIKKRLIPLPGR